MSKLSGLKGCGTALVTPFNSNGLVDEVALQNLVEFQISEGIDFLVPCGTTGESVTLSQAEHLRVVEIVMEQCRGKVPVIAGAGGYNTAHVIELAQQLAELGPDGLLSVTPYYNKPTQEGLYRHYEAIAETVDLPIIMYNVPGRTSTNLLPDTVARLAGIGNIIGIKSATTDLGEASELAAKIPEGFFVLSGDDSSSIPIIALGGVGLISVASNQIPRQMTALIHHCLDGDYAGALLLHRKLSDLMKANFIETNPIPVKAGLAMMGLVEERYRLPLVPMSNENKERLRKVMLDLVLIKE